MSETKWDWNSVEDVIIPSVRAVAVYTNPNGDVVIRQEDGMGEEDSYIILPRSMVEKVAKAIRAEAKKPFNPLDS